MTSRKWKWKAENKAHKKRKRLKAARDVFRAPFCEQGGQAVGGVAASNEGRPTWNKRPSEATAAKC